MTVIIGQDTIGYYVRTVGDDGTIYSTDFGIRTKKMARQIAANMGDRFIEKGEAVRITDKT